MYPPRYILYIIILASISLGLLSFSQCILHNNNLTIQSFSELSKGLFYWTTQDYNQAQHYAIKSLSSKNNQWAHVLLASSYILNDKDKQDLETRHTASEHYIEAINLDPTNIKLYKLRAYNYIHLQEYQLALQDIKYIINNTSQDNIAIDILVLKVFLQYKLSPELHTNTQFKLLALQDLHKAQNMCKQNNNCKHEKIINNLLIHFNNLETHTRTS